MCTVKICLEVSQCLLGDNVRYNGHGGMSGMVPVMFAKAFMAKFPLFPVEDLCDLEIYEHTPPDKTLERAKDAEAADFHGNREFQGFPRRKADQHSSLRYARHAARDY